MKKDILQELGKVCADKAFESTKKFGDIMDLLEEHEIAPLDLVIGIINYFENGARDNNDNYTNITTSILNDILNNDVVKDLVKEESHIDVGVALMGAGIKLMMLETSLPELLKKKINDNTLTLKDLEIIAGANLYVHDEETSKLLEDYTNKKITETCDCANCDSKDCPSKLETKVTDCNKDEAIKLIEDGRMNSDTIKQLLDSKIFELKDLVNGLSEKRFYEVMKDLHGAKDSIHEAAKNSADKARDELVNIAEEVKKALTNGDIDKLKELTDRIQKDDKTNTMMNEISRDESICSEEEKAIRRKIDAGTITDDEIVEAISRYKLNPFYLTDGDKLPKERVDRITFKLATIVLPKLLRGEL